MAGRKWTKELVVSEIRRLYSKGEDLSHSSVLQNHKDLEGPARKIFNHSWYEALEGAGIDSWKFRKLRPQGYWSKEEVVKEIKHRQQNGKDLSRASVGKENQALLRGAERAFRMWYKALEEAKIDPARYRKHKPEMRRSEARKPLGYWRSQDRLINAIRDRASKGKDMSYGAVLRDEGNSLVVTATRQFKGWYKALEAAGLESSRYRRYAPTQRPPDQWYPKGFWSKDRIVQRILERQVAEEGLSHAAVRDDDYVLYRAAIKTYGTWYGALNAAGIPEEKHRIEASVGYWTKGRIVSQISELASRGEDLSSRYCQYKHNKLLSAAINRFGSWEKAITEAGLDYETIRKQHEPYSKQELLDILSSLKAQGLSLDYTTMSSYDQNLTAAIARAFGGYRRGLEALGLDYDEIRRDWNTEKIKGEIFEEYVRQALQVLDWNVEQHRWFIFGRDRCVPDFLDLDTEAWIEVKYRSWSPSVVASLQKYLKHKNHIMIIYLKESRTRKEYWDPAKVEFIPIKSFYSELKKKGAGSLVENLELLRRDVIFKPEHQSRLRDFILTKYPNRVNAMTETLAKLAG
jgi:hypothetical protein